MKLSNVLRRRQEWSSLLCIFVCFFLYGCTSLEYTKSTSCYHPPLPHFNKPKIALVLGGGGARGMAHVGVLEELNAAGIQPDLIVGCSAGAIVGGLYANNPNTTYLKNLLQKKRLEHFLNISLGNLPFGLSNGANLYQFLSEELGDKNFKDLKIPFVAVATNLEYGELVIFGSGLMVPAIKASAAFPGVYLPVKIMGQHYIDGGVINLVPVETARKLGAEFVIAVDISNSLTDVLPTNVLGILMRSLEINLIHQSKKSVQEADFTIKIPFKDVGTFEDDNTQLTYDLGRKTAQAAICKLKRAMMLKRENR